MGRCPWFCTCAGICIRQNSGCNQFACYMDSVGPLCVSMLLYSICVCSTEGVNELDRMVYCLGVVTFLEDTGVKRAEITDCSSRMDPLAWQNISVFLLLHLGSVRRGFFYHFLFQRRQIPTVLLRGVLGYIFLSRTCSHLFPQSPTPPTFVVCLSTWYTITSLQSWSSLRFSPSVIGITF